MRVISFYREINLNFKNSRAWLCLFSKNILLNKYHWLCGERSRTANLCTLRPGLYRIYLISLWASIWFCDFCFWMKTAWGILIYSGLLCATSTLTYFSECLKYYFEIRVFKCSYGMNTARFKSGLVKVSKIFLITFVYQILGRNISARPTQYLLC